MHRPAGAMDCERTKVKQQVFKAVAACVCCGVSLPGSPLRWRLSQPTFTLLAELPPFCWLAVACTSESGRRRVQLPSPRLQKHR